MYRLIMSFLLALPLAGSAQSMAEFGTPTNSPTIFGVHLISTDLNQRDLTISPDETEIYYTVYTSGFDGNIHFIKYENGEWTAPRLASFSGDRQDLEPAFSPDGNRLYFASKRGRSDYDIYYVERTGSGPWSDPISMGSPINTSANEYYPSVATSGSIYYTAAYPNGEGGEDIWYAEYADGSYKVPVPLSGFCEGTDEFNAYVAPDESYIYFSSFGRSDGRGGGDLYIARKTDGVWGAGQNLGSLINSQQLDYCPTVSPNSGILFFTSTRQAGGGTSTNVFDTSSIFHNLLGPERSGSNIYWVIK